MLGVEHLRFINFIAHYIINLHSYKFIFLGEPSGDGVASLVYICIPVSLDRQVTDTQ